MTLSVQELCTLIEIGVQARCKSKTVQEIGDLIENLAFNIATRNDQEAIEEVLKYKAREREYKL